MRVNRRVRAAAVLLAVCLLLAGCKEAQSQPPEAVTLAALQQAAYEAIEAVDAPAGAQPAGQTDAPGPSEAEVQAAILAAEEAYPGELDSALYWRLAKGADETLSGPGQKEAYLALQARGELDTAQMVRLGRRMLEDGEVRDARDLWELAARRTDGQEAAARLEGVVVPIAQETDETAELLRQAVAAAAAGEMPALIDLVQSTEWLNAVMPTTGYGARRYQSTAADGAEGELTLYAQGAAPICDMTLTLPEGRALCLRITPLTAAVLRCDSMRQGGSGAAEIEYLSFDSGAFLAVTGRLTGGLFTGEVSFAAYQIPCEGDAPARWADRPEAPQGEYTGTFDENGQPAAKQRGGADSMTVGYDAAGRHYLNLARPENVAEEEGFGVAWLPLPQTQEGEA